MEGACTLEGIQIKNVRSLKDTDTISLRSINVLVGNNSSGKSTFLRSFPLIKQSINKHTDGPILWAGDVDDYVDFGSFKETITNDHISDSIELSFSFKSHFLYENLPLFLFFPIKKQNDECNDIFAPQVQYTLIIKSKSNSEDSSEYVAENVIAINSHILHLKYSLSGSIESIDLDGNQIIFSREPEDDHRYHNYYSRIFHYQSNTIFGAKFPSCDSIIENLEEKISGWLDRKERISGRHKSQKKYFDLIFIVGVLLCMGKVDGDLSNSMQTLFEIDAFASEIFSKDLPSFEQFLKGLNEKHKDDVLRDCLFVFFCMLLPAIDKYLSDYFDNVHYIAPIRASAERYYRSRNTAVDEIDHQGKNLAIFLNSLSKNQLASFQEWTQKYFGFKTSAHKEAGHLTVNIELKKTTGKFNLSDTGFGYSQILPIITQLWVLSTAKKRTKEAIPLVVAIEQPELHLHPNLQAKLAKAFIASIKLAKKHGYQLQLILETHSETIVNYFGKAIAQGDLSTQDVSVVLFDKALGEKQTNVKMISYDKYGYLQQWPIGFLSSEE